MSDDQLSREAKKPQSVSTPSLSVSRHSLRDQIELDRYLNGKRLARKPLGGIRMVRTVPPPG